MLESLTRGRSQMGFSPLSGECGLSRRGGVDIKLIYNSQPQPKQSQSQHPRCQSLIQSAMNKIQYPRKKSQLQSITSLPDFISYFDRHRYIFLQGLQYTCLLIAWYYETEWKPEKTQQFFLLYKRVFKLRRLFRLGYSIEFIPLITEAYKEYSETQSGERFFQLLRYVFKFLFYLIDNVAVVMDIMQLPRYYLFRRASYSTLALALTCSSIQYLIRLKDSFKREGELKTKMIGEMTPKEVLTELNELDEQRLRIYVELFRCLGDLFPALERTNVVQIVLRTRINKGTVALCGLGAVILQIFRERMK